MLLSLCRFQLRHINHASINIATSIISGRRWHCIWQIRRSPAGYWRSLQLMRCVRWGFGWLLTNWGHLRWIIEWIIPWGKHRYHWWRQSISLWVNVIAIKSFVITRTVMWRHGWLLKNRGQLFTKHNAWVTSFFNTWSDFSWSFKYHATAANQWQKLEYLWIHGWCV